MAIMLAALDGSGGRTARHLTRPLIRLGEPSLRRARTAWEGCRSREDMTRFCEAQAMETISVTSKD